jgi:sugar phosphate isomerase/epimerase
MTRPAVNYVSPVWVRNTRIREIIREQKGRIFVITATFAVSGFGDEIAADPAEQLAVLAGLAINHLDLRGAWDRNVLDFTDQDISTLRTLLAEHDAAVSMIASPVGKSSITEPAAHEAARLTIALRLAAAFETPLIRVFSFYHEGIAHADCRDEVVARLRGWAATAQDAGVTLLLENEADLWTDTPAHCREILEAVDSPALRFTLDAGNFASIGAAAHDDGYSLLRPWVRHLQIKDVKILDRQTGARKVVPAGQGDGQLPALLAAVQRDNYQGYLSLEPHLAVAGKAGGFSGAGLFGEAAGALRSILAGLAGADAPTGAA